MKRIKVRQGYLAKKIPKPAQYYDQGINPYRPMPPRTPLMQNYGKTSKKQQEMQLLQMYLALAAQNSQPKTVTERAKDVINDAAETSKKIYNQVRDSGANAFKKVSDGVKDTLNTWFAPRSDTEDIIDITPTDMTLREMLEAEKRVIRGAERLSAIEAYRKALEDPVPSEMQVVEMPKPRQYYSMEIPKLDMTIGDALKAVQKFDEASTSSEKQNPEPSEMQVVVIPPNAFHYNTGVGVSPVPKPKEPTKVPTVVVKQSPQEKSDTVITSLPPVIPLASLRELNLSQQAAVAKERFRETEGNMKRLAKEAEALNKALTEGNGPLTLDESLAGPLTLDERLEGRVRFLTPDSKEKLAKTMKAALEYDKVPKKYWKLDDVNTTLKPALPSDFNIEEVPKKYWELDDENAAERSAPPTDLNIKEVRKRYWELDKQIGKLRRERDKLRFSPSYFVRKEASDVKRMKKLNEEIASLVDEYVRYGNVMQMNRLLHGNIVWKNK